MSDNCLSSGIFAIEGAPSSIQLDMTLDLDQYTYMMAVRLQNTMKVGRNYR